MTKEEQEQQFQEALKHYREYNDKKSYDIMWVRVYEACKAMAKKLLKVSMPDDTFYDRLMIAVLKVMDYITKKSSNPNNLVNFCYWPVYNAFFGYKAVKEDRELSYDYMIEAGHWDVAINEIGERLGIVMYDTN